MKAKGLPRLFTTFFLLLLLFLLFLLLTDTQLAIDGVGAGLSLCTGTLFPALFPFLVLSELLVARGVGDLLKKAISRPVMALFGVSGSGASALLLGMLCGSPVGTVTAAALYRKGAISRRELGRLMLFVNNPSSGFLIGAVGGIMLGNIGAGIALFAIVWLSALTVGLLLRLLFGKLPQTATAQESTPPPPLSVGELTSSISRGFSTLLQIFAFVIFFSCVSTCVRHVLCHIGAPVTVGVMLSGILEMTSGISHAVSVLSPADAFRAAAFLAGFSGLSICLQLFSITEREGLPLTPYLLARLCQGVLALLLAEGYLRLFHPRFSVTDSVAAFAENPIGQGTTFSTLLLLLAGLWVCLLLQKRERRVKPAARHH